ncbi:hypothetical protein HS088_TW10G00625 [Tripterygium wilfordii]|uniref:Tetratricopeptide repeat (TPR)-like superfamily protein n=1 Tax=Tripterygium wilfordii TaxID=458696 RepID=A0A7J7D5P1_TRIWF|nr:hypothetical protein HS088_TW10G00625 [Tripterygium wilfordii]
MSITAIATVKAPAIDRDVIFMFRGVRCSDSQPRKRGFGSKNDKTNKVNTSREQKGMVSQQRKSTIQQSGPMPVRAPGLSSQFNSSSKNMPMDTEFEGKLEAVRRSALEQKKEEEKQTFGAIDYDAPVESEEKAVSLGAKIGVGVAVVVFGLVFALGDFLPSGSDSPTEETAEVNKKLSKEEKDTLQIRLTQYEQMLTASPKDATALEGAAVTLAELGEYSRAASLLQDLTKEKPSDPNVFRLLGEVKYELKDYEGSAAAFRSSSMVSENINFEVLRGLTNALLAAKKPDEAVQVLLATRESLRTEMSNGDKEADSEREKTVSQVDPIQVELLLGKAYSDWGHVSDAVSVYDGLISSHPEDFRGYLAKVCWFPSLIP